MTQVESLLSAAKHNHELGDRVEAARLWKLVLVHRPGDAGASKGLVEFFIDTLRFEESWGVLRTALQRNPTDMELNALTGQVLLGLGRTAEAMRIQQAVLAHNPDTIAARVGLAMCLISLHRAAEAVEVLRPAVKTAPMNYKVRLTFGQACLQTGHMSEGIEHLRVAVQCEERPEALSELGWILYGEGQLAEAQALFERALGLDAKYPAAAAGMATVLIDRNEHSHARDMLLPLTQPAPANPRVLITYARAARTKEEKANARAAVERTLNAGVSGDAAASIQYVLGKLKEEEGDFDGAFASYRAANQTGAPVLDPAMLEQHSAAMRSVFSKQNLARLPRAAPDQLPVFVVGMPRSGTSLVEQILASHPAVYGAGELSQLSALVERIPRLPGMPVGAEYPACTLSLTQAHVDELAGQYLAYLRQRGGSALRVTDKMPRNFVFGGLIDVLFPGARIVHCVRDPVDTCFSMFTTPLSQGYWYKGRMADLAAVFRDYRKTMDHWRGTLRIPVLDVRYEELVGDA